ncbi:MAG: hypothetical protein H0V17_35500 [Deltaproteobacteria bacterium]|nr:hypothetical protein [Deltaproteobacteria bacterium]
MRRWLEGVRVHERRPRDGVASRVAILCDHSRWVLAFTNAMSPTRDRSTTFALAKVDLVASRDPV